MTKKYFIPKKQFKELMNKKSYRLHGSSTQNSTKNELSIRRIKYQMMKELKEYDNLNKL